jgi:homoserine kinase
LVQVGLADESHVPFRRRLVPGFDAAVAAAVESGAAGATLSGSGPSLVAPVLSAEVGEQVAQAMVAAFAIQGLDASARVCHVDNDGARVLPIEPTD